MGSRGRRHVAVLLLLGALAGLSGCGEEQSPASDGVTASETASPLGAPIPIPATDQQPKLDRTQLDANLARLSPADRGLVDHYLHARGADRLREGTWIVAAPMTVAEAQARLLGPSPRQATMADEGAMMDAWASAYSFLQVGDGVVAWEDTGFADPPRRLLAALSSGGAVSAVATDNIEAMTRFGYARDGEVVFDNYEYAFVEDLNEIPDEVRDLAELAWEDLEGEMVATADWFDVAMAMSEKVTGVRATRAIEDVPDWYIVPLPWGAVEDD